MRILALGQLNNGVQLHRIFIPLFAMKDRYSDVNIKITNHITEEEAAKGWDILLMNRSVSMPAAQMAEWRDKYGFKLIVDNDDFWELDPHHTLYDHYLHNDIGNKIKAYIQIADICTVTHSRLADEVYKYNKNVYVLPNALPYGKDQFVDTKIASDKVRLFWAGSDTHAQDLAILRNPMHRVYGDADLRGKIKTVMSGYSERSKPIWDVMASAFTHALQFDSTIYQFSAPDKYMGAYCDSDISIIPLLSSKFNGFKSNLKILEAAAKRNPCIVSMTDPYLDMPVCYVRTQQYWYKWIKELVNDKAMRIEKGNELFEFCNTHFNIYEVNKKRYELYSSVC